MSSVYKSQLHIVPRQTNRGLKGTFERCRFPETKRRAQDLHPLSDCIRVAHHCAPRVAWREEASKPSFKARHSMSASCRVTPLLSVTHPPRTSCATPSVNCRKLCSPSCPTTVGAARTDPPQEQPKLVPARK